MISSTLFIIASLLIGPPLPTFIALVFLALGLLVALDHNLGHKTITLIAMMGFMLIQCILFVLVVHFELWVPSLNHTVHQVGFIPVLLTLDWSLAEVGILGAICVGVYIEFVRARKGLPEAFPNLSFSEAPDDLTHTVIGLARAAKIDCPGVRILDSGVPSAFTVRTQGQYTIALSIGLLESFDASEIKACVAHEISHIKNRDFYLRSIITVARIALFARPLSYFIESAVYRAREFLADRTAAALIGEPTPLISALTKLQEADDDICSGTMESLTSCFHRKRYTFWLLSKHPDLPTRIRVLSEAKST